MWWIYRGANNGPAGPTTSWGDHKLPPLVGITHINKYTTVYRYGHPRSVDVASGHTEGLHVVGVVLEALA
jgi:hypothetical protein